MLAATTALLLTTPTTPLLAQNGLAEPGLIGDIEGITIIEDEAMWPTSFDEAPSLAALVESGDLPPVEERLPKDAMVIQAVDGIGTYGGTWQRGFTVPKPSLAKGL